MYSSASLSRVIGGNTPEQMETKIADEIPAATEAVQNSLIDLQYNLVAAVPVSVRVYLPPPQRPQPAFRIFEQQAG